MFVSKAILIACFAVSVNTLVTSPTHTHTIATRADDDQFSGRGTFYDVGLGACGRTDSDTDYVAAISQIVFDSFPGYNGHDPNAKPVCDKQALVRFQDKSVLVRITDRCVGCHRADLDLSRAAFSQLADLNAGLIRITWSFV